MKKIVRQSKLLTIILTITIILSHVNNLSASWFSSICDSVSSGFQAAANVVVSQAKDVGSSMVQGANEIAQGKIGAGLGDIGKGVGTAALIAGEAAMAPGIAVTLTEVSAAAGAIGGQKGVDFTKSAVETTGSIVTGAEKMIVGGAVDSVVAAGDAGVKIYTGIGEVAYGAGKAIATGKTDTFSQGFEDLGHGYADAATAAANIVAPLPIDILAPGLTEGIVRTGHGFSEIATGNTAGFKDIGMGLTEASVVGAPIIEGTIAMGTGAVSGDWSKVGMGALQTMNLKETYQGISDMAHGGNIAEGLARTVSFMPFAGEGAMGLVKSGEAIQSGIQSGQGPGSVALGALGGLFSGSADYGKEEFQGTTSEAELTGEGTDEENAAEADLPPIINNLPAGFTPESGRTFCVAVGSRNGQYEAWTISEDSTQLLRYNDQITSAQSTSTEVAEALAIVVSTSVKEEVIKKQLDNPWQIIPTLDNTGKPISKLRYVSVSSDGVLMIIDDKGVVYQYDWDKKNFTALPVSYAYTYDQAQGAFTKTNNGLAFDSVSVGSKDDIWGVDVRAKIIYTYDTKTKIWTPSTPGTAVATGVDGTVVGIDPTGAPLWYSDQGWSSLPGTSLDHIAVGSYDYIYGSYLATMWQYNNSTNTWTQIMGTSGEATQGINEVAVNAAGSMIITDLDGNIYNKGDDGVQVTQPTPAPAAPAQPASAAPAQPASATPAQAQKSAQ